MNIFFPDNTELVIDAIRDAIGREVIFMSGINVPCSACGGIDPYTNYALDPFCTVCSGLGYIVTYSGTSVNAHITWGGVDNQEWTRGGYYFAGDCRIQIKHTPENLNLVNSAKYIVVDGRRLVKDKVIYRGVKNLNRIIIDCRLDEVE